MTDTSHPRPQLRRERWTSLDGAWDFAFDLAAIPDDVAWTHEIRVPYPPEAELSGIGDRGFHPVVWYRRSFEVPADWTGSRVQLHFGAVDYRARVWVNGRLVAEHEGGHTPFVADVTDVLDGDVQTVTVRAEDDPHDLHKPRGKQDWHPEPHGIWYPRTSGIWQPVWLESVPERHIAGVRFTPDADALTLGCEVELAGAGGEPAGGAGEELELRLSLHGEPLASNRWLVRSTGGAAHARTLHLPRPGHGDERELLWSPERPNLIDAEVVLRRDGEILDRLEGYTALRSVGTRDGAFVLNGRPYFLRLALDQGYWDESLLAAPSDAALRRDVELAKALGFNGVRKHQKIEDPRYLHWADRLGLLVWEELPSAYDFSARSAERLTREWLEVLRRDVNHPCVVTWVCFNESWGVPDLPGSAAQRDLVAGLYHLTRALDPTRPVVGNDGWEHVAGDLLTVHDYSPDPDTLERRYGAAADRAAVRGATLEHGRKIALAAMPDAGQPQILSEFGGVRYHPDAEGWGYQQVEDAEAFLELYARLIEPLVPSAGFAGFCYTQFADTFQEQNGLLFSDRRPKADLDALASATRGEGVVPAESS